MAISNSDSVSPKSISVDIGDLRVDYLGTSMLLSAQNINKSPLHLHTKPELQYIVSGTLEEIIEESQCLAVEQGSMILIPPNVLHSNPDGNGQRLIFTIALQQISSEPVNRDFSEYWYYSRLFGCIQEPLIIKSRDISFCLSQLITLSDEPQNLHKKKNLLAFFFIQLSIQAESLCNENTIQRQIPPGSQYNQQYYLIEQYVNTHYHTKTSSEDIANILHLSRRQADRIVEQVFGRSYADLIMERRMSIAQILLKKTDMTCTEISVNVGFTSYQGFYLAFIRHFGITPGEMREAENSSVPQSQVGAGIHTITLEQ